MRFVPLHLFVDVELAQWFEVILPKVVDYLVVEEELLEENS